MKKIKRYQIVLSNCEGVFPQKYEIYFTKKDAQYVVDRYNEQNKDPYSVWEVREKIYLI